MSSQAIDLKDPAIAVRGERTAWLRACASAAMPAAAAFVYSLAALHPERVSDSLGQALAVYFLTQLPLALLAGVFSAALYVEGPPLRRVLIYLAVVGVGVGVGWASMKSSTSVFAPAVGCAIATQTVSLIFLGRDAERARKRASAVAEDGVNLIILACWAIALSLILGVIASKYAASTLARLKIDLRVSDVAWVVAAYFAMRAVSAAYVHTAAFARRGKGWFDRPWVNWLIRNLGRSGRRQGSD